MHSTASRESELTADVVGQQPVAPCGERGGDDQAALAISIRTAIDQVGRYAFRRIDVTAENGQVVLRGFVRTWFQKQLAQHVAMQVPGVNRLDNSLVVVPDNTGAS